MKNKTDTSNAYDLLKDYFRVFDEAMRMLSEWKDSSKKLVLLSEMISENKDNAVLDIITGIMVDDYLSDIESDITCAENNNDLFTLMEGISDSIRFSILSFGTEKKDIEKDDVKEALVTLCRDQKAHMVTAYLEKLISEMEDIKKFTDTGKAWSYSAMPGLEG